MALLQITEPGQAIDPHLKKRAAGIDLGTTNSLVASYIGGELKTLADHDGAHLLPSVVRYGRESITVGSAALAEAKRDPKNTLMSVKRLLGRGTEDLELLGDQLPYDFASGDGGMPFIKTDFGEVSPVEASAEILKTLAARANETLAGELDGVVITVPAYFDDAQRIATKDAATLAGLNVLRLLSEPTAAAVAYGLDADDSVTDDGIIAVYDLGGGTFDISLLRMNRGVFEVLATGGNSALGGDDFDAAIASWLLEASGFEGKISQAQHRTLLIEARGIKEALSDQATVAVNLDSEGLQFQGELSREAFETLIASLLDQSIKACRRAVRDADLKLDQIAHVVLVGGSTRVPAVSAAVGTYFQCEPLNTIDPDRVVALGAAVQANILVGNKSDDEMLLLDVLPLSLGLETMGGLAEKVIHRNTTIPVTRGQEFTTYKDGQTAMLIHVVQGERELISDCRSLARFELRGIPPMVAGAAKIQVFFQVDADGLLSVAAREESTGVKAHVVVKPSFGLGEEQVANMLKASFDYAKDDMQSRIVMESRVDAQRVIDAVEAALAKDGTALLTEAEQLDISKAVVEVQNLLASDDAKLIDEAVKQLGLASDDFASRRMDASVKTALSGHSLEEFEKE